MAERSWPDDWNDRMAGRGCPLCAALGQGDNDYCVHVFTGEFAEVNLERRWLPPFGQSVLAVAVRPAE